MDSDEEYEKSSREKFKKERHDDSYKSFKEGRSSKGSLNSSHGRRGKSISDDDDDYRDRKKSHKDFRDSRDGSRRSSYHDGDRKYDSHRGRASFSGDRDSVRPNYQSRNSFPEDESRKRSRYSSPPHDSSGPYGKRPRWSMTRDLDMEYDPYPPPFPDGLAVMPPVRDPFLQVPPPIPSGMMTFKQFLTSQEEDLDEKEAVQKYKEYKANYKKQQISEFFIAHKDEEWFKNKYHPVNSAQAKEEQSAVAHRRLKTFLELVKSGWIDFSLDIEHSKKIIRFLDAVVIKLEGGTEEHLSLLDDPENKKEQEKECTEKHNMDQKSENTINHGPQIKKDGEEGEVESEEETQNSERNNKSSASCDPGSLENQEQDTKENLLKENGLVNCEAEDLDYDPPRDQERDDKSDDNSDAEYDKRENFKVSKSQNSSSSSGSDSESSSEEPVDVASPDPSNDEEDTTKETTETKISHFSEKDGEVTENGSKAPPEKELPKIEELHKTQSIFLRNVPPSVTKKEIEDLCKNIPGYLRVSLTDPQPERKFYRRGWVTFRASADIKKICLDLSYVKLRDVDLGAIVNRELSRRVRTVSGLAADKAAAHSDLKAAYQLIRRLDDHKGLWRSFPQTLSEKDSAASPSSQCIKQNQDDAVSLPENGGSLPSSNPFLENIHEYLVEETNALEMELLGVQDNEAKDSPRKVDRDDALIQVLDRLLLYLRVVHSVDFYNHNDYPMEDEMPNRLGLIHVRDSVVENTSQKEIESYMERFAKFHKKFAESQAKLTEEEVEQLGRKDVKTETEKFIEANIQELAGNKWMCLISSKKFKAKEFVVKHIYNKHEDKLQEVKEMVEYFNNYLQDPRRPQLPEASSANSGHNQEMMTYLPPPPFGPMGFRRPDWGFGGRPPFDRRRRDPRAPIQYYDLDAPRDEDLV